MFTSCTGSARRIWGDLKKSVELRTRLQTGRVDFRGSLRTDEFVRYGRHPCWGAGADGKVVLERLCISLPYVETFNSKVIKGFVPELRSRYVFFVFRDSYVLCIYMNILCTFHMAISWLWNIYHSGFSDYCLHLYCYILYCYIHNVLADMSPGLRQVFLVELRSLHGTSNHVLYLIPWGR